MSLTNYVSVLNERIIQTQKKLTRYRVKSIRCDYEAAELPPQSLGRYAMEMLSDGYRAQVEWIKQQCAFNEWL